MKSKTLVEDRCVVPLTSYLLLPIKSPGIFGAPSNGKDVLTPNIYYIILVIHVLQMLRKFIIQFVLFMYVNTRIVNYQCSPLISNNTNVSSYNQYMFYYIEIACKT
jgi:hypothetical protein